MASAMRRPGAGLLVVIAAALALLPASAPAQTVTEPVITSINLERELRFTASLIVPSGWHFSALQIAATNRPADIVWADAVGTARPGAFSSETPMVAGLQNWFRLVVEADDPSLAHRSRYPCTGTVDPRTPSKCYSKPSYYRPAVRIVTPTPTGAPAPTQSGSTAPLPGETSPSINPPPGASAVPVLVEAPQANPATSQRPEAATRATATPGAVSATAQSGTPTDGFGTAPPAGVKPAREDPPIWALLPTGKFTVLAISLSIIGAVLLAVLQVRNDPRQE